LLALDETWVVVIPEDVFGVVHGLTTTPFHGTRSKEDKGVDESRVKI
jgi:hypothetical protein